MLPAAVRTLAPLMLACLMGAMAGESAFAHSQALGGGQPAAPGMKEDDVIGVARMESDGTIVLQLRAEGAHGVVGDGLIRYPPSNLDYRYVLDHIGGLRPGEEKLVPAFPQNDKARLLKRLAALAESPPVDVDGASARLGVPLERNSAQSTPHFSVYEGSPRGDVFREVEYRAPSSGRATGGPMLILTVTPTDCITRQDVTREFGDDVSNVLVPPPDAPPSVPLSLEYRRPWGLLRFGFARTGPGCLVQAVFDRRPQARERETITLVTNTQATIGDVRIGAGNFWERDYTDEQGTARRGPTASLAVFVRRPDLPQKQTSERVIVWPGRRFEAGGERFRVESVTADTVTLVRLE